MITKALWFFMYQSPIEHLMFMYFLSLLIYMFIVFVIKRKHKKSIGFFMFKYKDILCSITYLILGVFIVISCLTKKVIDNIFVYLGCMLAAAVVVNYLFILSYGIKKIKDIEFSEVADAYDDIIKYSDVNDKINEYISTFICYIKCVDEDKISDLNFRKFTCKWISFISDYLEKRIKQIDYIELNTDKSILKNYVRNIVSTEKLWYSERNINDFAEKLLNGKEVILTENSRIIPIEAKRFKCLVYVIGNDTIEDVDRNFIVNTYCIMCLL